MPSVAAISIYVHDLKAAEQFYVDLLGFEVASRPVPFITELRHDGVSVVLCAAERPATTEYTKDAGVVLGLVSENVERHARALRSKGATVLFESAQEFPVGVFNAVRDPSGNVVELLEFRTGESANA